MSSEDAARVRWLVLGAFSASPAGKRFRLDAATFGKAMEAAQLRARVVVPDQLGAGPTRSCEVAFASVKSFQLTDVIAQLPELSALRALAEALGSADPVKRPSVDAAIACVVEAVGEGALATQVRSALTAAGPASAPTPGKASAIVSAIVSSARADQPGAGSAPAGLGRAARDVLEKAVYATAADVMKDPLVARFEAAWRGLHLLAEQCDSTGGMLVEAVDVSSGGVAAAIPESLPSDLVESPDAIFVVDPCDDVERLAELAALAEDAHAPLVATVSPALFGSDASRLPLDIEKEGGGLPETWNALRSDEVSRWLCVACNRVVVGADGAGPARRVVFGSASLGMAAFLAASFRATGSFARIFGPTGSLKAPAVAPLATGPEAGATAPTEAFFSLRAQATAAKLGVLALGSGRNTDKVALSTAPTLRGSSDAVPLPAQILTGRVVRFAKWVRDQVPAGASETDVTTLFEQAAGVFLFPGVTEGAGLQAKVAEAKAGGREVRIVASVRAEHASIPFHLAFALPL